ncbi:MAG: site-2 protease family protein [Pseudomonadota bacterium]
MFSQGSVILTFKGPWGVPIEISSSLLFLGGAILLISQGDLQFALVVFASIVVSILLHELGHAWGCFVQGIPVRRVHLHGGGGWCEHGRSKTRTQEEFIVALGPIVNLALWAGPSLVAAYVDLGPATWMVSYFTTINLLLAIFNLLPIQPLDGGKLLQLGLLRILAPQQATKIAGGIGLAFAILWIPIMVAAFFYIGLILFFFPNFRIHWDMLRN